jgi:toxin ParE1/3/4
MRLQLSPMAAVDIEWIHEYTATEWGEGQAKKYVHAIWDALEGLQEAPERWRLRPDIYPGARVRDCGSHLIIYRIRNDAVQISRVLHKAMNLKAHIPRTFMGDEY